uniref:Rhodopsin domain-containing protein n=1 Tax=Bionectria ochroleuca TaxID=29856 RepID=A0A8H7NCK8_BIOOC
MIELMPDANSNFLGCLVMILMASLSVLCRVLLRISLGQKFLLADYLCFLSFLCLPVTVDWFSIVDIFNVSKSGALEATFVTNPKVSMQEAQEFMKVRRFWRLDLDLRWYEDMGYIAEHLFTIVLTLVKFSILSFYWTIFSINRLQKNLIIGTAVLCGCWFITFFIIFLVQCRPISALWSSFGSSEFCMSMPKLLLGFELTNLFIDVAILLIPTVMVGKLRLNAIKKVSVIDVFLLGAMVCVTSIVRLTAIWNPPDVMANFDTAKGMLWSTLQVGMAIVCACLPTFGPIFSGKSKFGSHAKSWYGSLRDKRTQNSGYKISDNQSSNGRPWADDENRFHASSRGGWRAQDDNAHETDSDHIPLDPLPQKGIRVRKDIDVN